MKWLVTGCHGFLGSSFGLDALERGHEVLGVARNSQPPLGWTGAYETADASSSDLAPIVARFQPDAVLHAAGSASVAASLAAPHNDFRASLLSWSNLLDGVRRSGVRPLVFYPSSAAVYGQPARLPVEETAACEPLSPYGYHKRCCELLAESSAKCFGLQIVVLRLFSLISPRQRRLLVWEIFRQIQEGARQICLAGSGRETRDFLAMDDLSDLLIALVRNQSLDSGCPLVLNAASGVATEVGDVARLLIDLSGAAGTLCCLGKIREGNPDRWQADITRLRAGVPGWTPRPLRQILEETLAVWNAK